MSFAFFSSALQRHIQQELARNRALKLGDYRVLVNVWIDAQGVMRRVELAESTGNPDTDRAIRGGAEPASTAAHRRARESAATDQAAHHQSHGGLMQPVRPPREPNHAKARTMTFKTLRCGVLLASALLSAPVWAEDSRASLEALRQTTLNLINALVDSGAITRQKADELIKKAEQDAAATVAQTPKRADNTVRCSTCPRW